MSVLPKTDGVFKYQRRNPNLYYGVLTKKNCQRFNDNGVSIPKRRYGVFNGLFEPGKLTDFGQNRSNRGGSGDLSGQTVKVSVQTVKSVGCRSRLGKTETD
ncbi:mevalonate kinase [Corchorus capsularis]|uniref:Mevalonate kinase n=1 Tax=Corchorus capsularis TaxID=210143 RepID=A0A1R3J5E8_COCAP|nr:mevalonate kinase [Corchorus capsularis]